MLFGYNFPTNYTQRYRVHKTTALLLLILIFALLGCDEKPQETDENTTHNTVNQHEKVRKSTQNPTAFTLRSSQLVEHNVTVYDEDLVFDGQDAPLVIVHFFASWCQPCMAEMPYLSDLQQKYRKILFVAGVLVHDDTQTPALQTLLAKNAVRYFVSNSAHNAAFTKRVTASLGLPENFTIPLTILYVEGKYFTHYEGNVPVEMIEYDIEQAKKQLKSR